MFCMFTSSLQDQNSKDKVLQSMAAMSSAQIVSASAIHNKAVATGLAGIHPSMGPTYPPYSSQFAWPGGVNQEYVFIYVNYIIFYLMLIMVRVFY